MTCKSVLIDRTNYLNMLPKLVEEVRAAKSYIGIDIETHDAGRHDGLNEFMKVNEDGHKAGNRPLVFDRNRTTLVGLSIYVEGSDTAYYFNIGHADLHRRLHWDQVQDVLDQKPEGVKFVAHNAAYERVFLEATVGYVVPDLLCSMQLCVSAYNPDTYPIDKFFTTQFVGVFPVLKAAQKTFYGYQQGKEMNQEQVELFSKVTSKTSDGAQSYNGFLKEISYGYGLKPAVFNWFGHKMMTFEEVLRGRAHMGMLTGPETVEYGAEDAYWAVKLFIRVLDWMMKKNPEAILAYFKQEVGCIEVHAGYQLGGVRINKEKVAESKLAERKNTAEVLRKIREICRDLLPFPAEPHEGLFEFEKWYKTNWQKKRAELETWANLPDAESDFEEVCRVAGSVSADWAGAKQSGPNITYYHMARVMLFDLCQTKLMKSQGKIQSDAKGRGRLIERFEKQLTDEKNPPSAEQRKRLEKSTELLQTLAKLSSIEQRMKLYLAPYMQLIDPDTGKVYPVVSSKLATRRGSMSTPNGQQLAKQGQSKYIRGFYEADDPDKEAIVSLDWSAVELVCIGELSKDPQFREAYGQLPHQDLHIKAAAAVCGVSVEALKRLRTLPDDYEGLTANGVSLINHKGEKMTPFGAYKYNRGTDGGKGANFEYWYSGWLVNTAERRGWSMEKMVEVTENYRQMFSVGEAWRQEVIAFANTHGYVQLPDGHRRYKFECTNQWLLEWVRKLTIPGTEVFASITGQKIQKRARNQCVNALVQGTCAALMKRTKQRLKTFEAPGKFRLMMDIHDELLASVSWDYIPEFIKLAKRIMRDHTDLFPTLQLDCTASVGRTFEPFNPKDAPFGQFELNEANKVDWLPKEAWDHALDDDQIFKVIEYMRTRGASVAREVEMA